MDIVERLRNYIRREDPMFHHGHVVWEAADEIERLRDVAIKDGERIYDLQKQVVNLNEEVILERNDYIIARLTHEGAVDRLEQKHKADAEEYERKIGALIAAFRHNMMRLWPEYTHEKFDKGIKETLERK